MTILANHKENGYRYQTRILGNRKEIMENKGVTTQVISWYAKGLKNPQAFTTACWESYPKGTRFRVHYLAASVVVVCNDRGHFKAMGRFLDLSSGAFSTLAPLSQGILRAKVEVLNKETSISK